MFTGARLASPSEIRKVALVGTDQLLVFAMTLGVTLASDLLLGVLAGLFTELAVHLARGARPSELFRGHARVQRAGEQLRVAIRGPAAFTNLLPLRRALAAVDTSVREVVVDVREATLVDRTVLERVQAVASEWPGAELRWEGLDRLRPESDHPLAARRAA